MTQQSSQSAPSRRPRRWRRLKMVLGSVAILAICVAARYYWGGQSANASSPQVRTTAASPARTVAPRTTAASRTEPAATAAKSQPQDSDLVALVNGRGITHEELAQECLRHYGEQVLENLINKLLIAGECKRQGITVTRVEVEGEINRMAQRFGLPVDQWLKLLKDERGIEPAQYASDIIWPTLALRKLAGEQLKVSDDELREAYETQYGPAVVARLISTKSQSKAQQVHAQAAANPDQFGELAKAYSEDSSAGLKGRIQPIRMHGSYGEVEQAAFSMADGEVSKVIPAGGQFVILKREKLLPKRDVRFELVAPKLEELLREQKMRKLSTSIFRQLQEQAKVQNVFSDPAKRKMMPGVAALLNGQQITVRQLAEECVERHGHEVLEGTINRRLLELACQKEGITITEEDLDREIERAASLSLPPKPDGSTDVEGWIELVTQQQGVSLDVYRRDAVWPSVALQKLVGNKVEVTQADLQRGFEANYGPRVRCRAIVLNDLRRAQKVWEMARNNPTVEYFGDLAEEYSVEAASSQLRGEVPPIKKHGGQPQLEKEAFALSAGELSGIIQIADKYIILFCEGYTEPKGMDFASVRKYIYEDVFEKKQRLAMADAFEQLQKNASIDNYLAGTSQSPKQSAGPAPVSAHLPTVPIRR